MRKTRLVILPGARCLNQLGFLLLFLACPTIAFKGQENRDIQPYCRLLTLKQNWLPNDTDDAAGYKENKNGEDNGIWDFKFGFKDYCPNNNTIKFDGISNCQNMTEIISLESFGSKFKPTTSVLLVNKDLSTPNNDFITRRTKSLSNAVRSSRTENGQRDVYRRNVGTYSVLSIRHVDSNQRDLSNRRNVRREISGDRRSFSRDVEKVIGLKRNNFRKSLDTRDYVSERRQSVSRNFVRRTDGEEILSRVTGRNMNIIRRIDQYEPNVEREFREDERKTRIRLENRRREDTADRYSGNTPQVNIERMNPLRERIVLEKRSTKRRSRSLERSIQRQRLDSLSNRRNSLEERRESLYNSYDNRDEFRNIRSRLVTGRQDSIQDRRSEFRVRLEFRRQEFRDQPIRNRQLDRSAITAESGIRTERRVVREKRDTRRNMFRNTEVKEDLNHRSNYRSHHVEFGSQLSLQDSSVRPPRSYQRGVDYRSVSLEHSRQNIINERRFTESPSRLTSLQQRIEHKADIRKIRSSPLEPVVKGHNYEIASERRNTEITSRLSSFYHRSERRIDGRRIRSVSQQPIRKESNYERVIEKRNTEIVSRQFFLHRRGVLNADGRRIRSVSLDSSRRNADLSSRLSSLYRNVDRRIDAKRVRSVSLEQLVREESNFERVGERRDTEFTARLPSFHQRARIDNRRIRSASLEPVKQESVTDRHSTEIVSRLSLVHRRDVPHINGRRIASVSLDSFNTDIVSKPSSLRRIIDSRIGARSIRLNSIRKEFVDSRMKREEKTALDMRRQDYFYQRSNLNIVKSLSVSARRASEHLSTNNRIITESGRLARLERSLSENFSRRLNRRLLNELSRDNKENLLRTQNAFSLLPIRYTLFTESTSRDRRNNRLEESISRVIKPTKRNYQAFFVEENYKPSYQRNARKFEKMSLESRIFRESTRQRTAVLSGTRFLRTEDREILIENGRKPDTIRTFGQTARKFSSRRNLDSFLQISVMRRDVSRKRSDLSAERSGRRNLRNLKMDSLRPSEKMNTHSLVQRNKRLIKNNFMERQLSPVSKELELNSVSFSPLRVNNVLAAYFSFDLGHRNMRLPQTTPGRSSLVRLTWHDRIQIDSIDKRRYSYRNEQTRRLDSLRDTRLFKSAKHLVYQEIKSGEKHRVNSERLLSRSDRREKSIRHSTREFFRQQPTLERNTRMIQLAIKDSPVRSYIRQPMVTAPTRLLGKMDTRESRNYWRVDDQVRFDKIENRNFRSSQAMTGAKFEYLNKPTEANILAYTANIISEQFAGTQSDLTKRLWYNNRNYEEYTTQALISGVALCAALFINVNKKNHIY